MNKTTTEIRKNYHSIMDACKLNTMEKWVIEEEITDTLYEKGYDIVNVCTAPCEHGYFNALECYTTVADKLAEQIREKGFDFIQRVNPDKKSISWIIFPYNLCIELADYIADFEVIT